MNPFIFGHSAAHVPIPGFRFGSSGPRILILGGVHGDEIEGVQAAWGIYEKCLEEFEFNIQLTLVPQFNIDGVVKSQRKNINQVDLNRNLPTKDWTNDVKEERYYPGPFAASEPENKALMAWIDQNQPKFIISLHSWKPMLNTNGNCDPEARIISQMTGYEIHESIGYPTPGCLGTYTGLERNIPTLTYEIERGLVAEKIIQIHVPAILAALKSSEQRS